MVFGEMYHNVNRKMELSNDCPLVSILIPIYNTTSYLKECLDSVIRQTYINLQIVLVNDGSTDDSGEICEMYAAKDSRIEYISIPHSNIAKTRNCLLHAAQGTYTLFVDSDDWIEPNTVESLIIKAHENQVDIVTFCRTLSEKTVKSSLLNQKQAIESYLVDGSFSASLCLKLVKTSLYKEIGFDAKAEYGEDVLMTWNILNHIDRVLTLNNEFYHYRNNPQSTTNSKYSSSTYTLQFVWHKIVEECRVIWPQYYEAARLRQLYCCIWLLYTAIRSNEPYSSELKRLQKRIRLNLRSVFKLQLSFKGKIFACFSAYCYTFLRLVLTPIRKRLNPLR